MTVNCKFELRFHLNICKTFEAPQPYMNIKAFKSCHNLTHSWKQGKLIHKNASIEIKPWWFGKSEGREKGRNERKEKNEGRKEEMRKERNIGRKGTL